MNTAIECDRTLLVQAEFDGELDAAQVAALMQHRASCVRCEAVYMQLTRSRTLLRVAQRYAAPIDLRESLRKQIRSQQRTAPKEAQKRNYAIPSFARWGVGVLAATIALVVFLSARPTNISSQVVSNHLRAMQLSSHLIDVVSSDHHTVKPWFAGKVDFAPVVKELGAYGYELKGGRVDVIDGRAAAVLVYQAGNHTIDMFIAQSRASSATGVRSENRDGFNLRHWSDGDLTFWCISDMGANELDQFVSRWQSEK